MAGNSPVIFLSYSWANKSIADIIDEDFRKLGYVLKRDVRDVPYRSNIVSFMQEAATADFVLPIISHEYLCSENCLYEMGELLNTHQFEKRVLPIMLDNARHIFNAAERGVYYDFWQNELAEAERFRQQHLNNDYVSLFKKRTAINVWLDDFFTKIIAMNVGAFEALRQEGYRSVIKIIRPVGDDANESFRNAFQAFEEKDYPKAKYLYELLLSKYPDNYSARHNLGLLLELHFADYAGARREYEAALGLQPGYLPALNGMAYVLCLHFSDLPGARVYFEKSLRLDPNQPEIQNTLLSMLRERFSIPIPDNQAVPWIDPGKSDAQINEGFALAQKGDQKGAWRHYDEARRLNPGNPLAYNNLGALLEYQFSDYKLARAYYETALRLDPGLERARANLAHLLKRKN
jgi:Flp pilus assembly protein TadD